MSLLGRDYQAKVKSAANALVGVAQVRVGLPSVRVAGTAEISAVQRVPQSSIEVIELPSGASANMVVRTDTMSVGTLTAAGSGTYTGTIDGAFIVRCTGATTSSETFSIFGPDGYEDAGVTISELTSGYTLLLAGATDSGATLTATVGEALEVGDTWILPVWSGAALSNTQTGIICPYSLFRGSNESVGGLTDAKFAPKLDDVKTLESGFPATVDDRIVAKTSVEISFTAQEYKNANISQLRNMMNNVMNNSQTSAISVEVVMRTRGNELITFWVPNADLESLPEIAPTNDFSTLPWTLSGSTQSENSNFGEVYNAWLTRAAVYHELEYTH